MAKYTKQELAAAKKEKRKLLDIILKKSGVWRQYLITEAENMFISANLDLVTPFERKQFPGCKTKNRKAFTSKETKEKINELLVKFTFLDLSMNEIKEALKSENRDIEDSVHYFLSKKSKCDIILTNNISDFTFFPIAAVLPNLKTIKKIRLPKKQTVVIFYSKLFCQFKKMYYLTYPFIDKKICRNWLQKQVISVQTYILILFIRAQTIQHLWQVTPNFLSRQRKQGRGKRQLIQGN
ncbi:MAG: hypothetical protein LBB53_03565 [Prevotellaceae bacterium]|jgi:hypothetical protein|nr:hypothetical protein [Prevotellaceae bacterium]